MCMYIWYEMVYDGEMCGSCIRWARAIMDSKWTKNFDWTITKKKTDENCITMKCVTKEGYVNNKLNEQRPFNFKTFVVAFFWVNMLCLHPFEQNRKKIFENRIYNNVTILPLYHIFVENFIKTFFFLSSHRFLKLNYNIVRLAHAFCHWVYNKNLF